MSTEKNTRRGAQNTAGIPADTTKRHAPEGMSEGRAVKADSGRKTTPKADSGRKATPKTDSGRKSAQKSAAYQGDDARRAAEEFDRALEKRYPQAECSLAYEGDPWRLLVMARLSAQCTDERVNIVCRELFDVFPDAPSMAAGDLAVIENIVRPCGLYRMKASSIREASEIIVRDHAGRIPQDMDALLALPGVGRKIANLVLGDVYGMGGIVADTHFMRICSRLGFTPAATKDPLLTERVMEALIPRDRQSALCHRAVLFGREVCDARTPHCAQCELSAICAEYRNHGK